MPSPPGKKGKEEKEGGGTLERERAVQQKPKADERNRQRKTSIDLVPGFNPPS